MLFLDGLPDGLPDDRGPARAGVVSPSQSAFGLRVNEDEGEAGEGEAPPEEEEDDFEGSDLEGDWDTVRRACYVQRSSTVCVVVSLH